MKFRNPDMGEVYIGIADPMDRYICSITRKSGKSKDKCKLKEANMEKPRICELLEVEVDEEFDYEYEGKRDNGGPWKITKDGKRMYRDSAGSWNWCFNEDMLLELINHPDRIIRKPRFTEQDVEDAKTVRRVFGRDGTIERYNKAVTEPYSNLVFDHLYINEDLFPSIKVGQAYALDEIIGGAR